MRDPDRHFDLPNLPLIVKHTRIEDTNDQFSWHVVILERLEAIDRRAKTDQFWSLEVSRRLSQLLCGSQVWVQRVHSVRLCSIAQLTVGHHEHELLLGLNCAELLLLEIERVWKLKKLLLY